MMLEQVAYLAEIIGSVAIIASLVFVGVQLARANRETRATALQTAILTEVDNSFRFADHAATWDKVVKGQPLEKGEEERKGIVLYNALMTDSENRYHQFQVGYLDSRSWNARRDALVPMVRLPVFKDWRKSFGGVNHSPDFLAILDEMAAWNE